jgi:phosphatidylserine/phosphatidylglycerophosphate/cardiolipin synthase-like enzyme
MVYQHPDRLVVDNLKLFDMHIRGIGEPGKTIPTNFRPRWYQHGQFPQQAQTVLASK